MNLKNVYLPVISKEFIYDVSKWVIFEIIFYTRVFTSTWNASKEGYK